MKVCRICGDNKNRSEFYASKLNRDGLQGDCIACRKTANREYEKNNRDIVNARQRRYTSENLNMALARAKRWVAKNPNKPLVYALVYQALALGRLTRQPCFCGDTAVDAHHEDYSKPIDVLWICRKHHKTIHKFKRLVGEVYA